MSGESVATDAITHVILIKPDTEPIKQKNRGIPQAFQEEFKRTVKEKFLVDLHTEVLFSGEMNNTQSTKQQQ